MSQASELTAEPDWEELKPFSKFATAPMFVSGNMNPERFQVRYFRDNKTGRFVGKARFGPETQGPPGHAHGGSIAALFDEAMGAACWYDGVPVVAATITINFRQMTPLSQQVRFEAWIARREGRKLFTEVQLTLDGKTLADGTGIFVRLSDEDLERIGFPVDS